MLKPYLLTVLISVAVIAQARAICLTCCNNNQTIADIDNDIIIASIGNQPT